MDYGYTKHTATIGDALGVDYEYAPGLKSADPYVPDDPPDVVVDPIASAVVDVLGKEYDLIVHLTVSARERIAAYLLNQHTKGGA